MSTSAPLRPSLLTEESFSKFTRSDIALGATLSPRANEIAVHTQLFSEHPAKGQSKSELKTPSLPNQDTVWFAKWAATPRSSAHFYADAYVTFKSLQLSALHREKDGIPFESSQNIELLHEFVEVYINNVQAHIDRLALEDPFDSSSYTHWQSVYTSLHLFQTLLTPQSGLLSGLVGEELLLWLNMNFVAPASDDGRKYARAQQPWALEGFWEYLIRATIRGLSKGAIHFFQDLKNHPSAHVRHIAPMLTKVLESHPTSSQFATELEFFNAHRRWKDTVRPLRNELQLLDDSEEGDWREGLEDLVGVLEGDQDTVMRVCSEENGGYGWREVLGVWGVWVQVDFRRQDLPDTLAIINDSVQLDPSMIDEMAQAALVSQQLKRFIQLAADQDSWLGSHLADLMEKMNIILYPSSTVDGDDGDTEPEVSDTEGDTDEELVTLRDYLLMDYAGEILHGDPSSWHIELDYFAACGSVGRSRLGLILRRLAVEVDTEFEANTEATHTAEQPILNGTMNNGIDVSGEGRPDGSSEDTSPTLGRLTGMQRVQKLVDVCKEYELWDEMESLCKVVARLLVQQRRYGDAVAYCIYARDFKTIARIADLLLDEYITNGADEFISLVDSVPDVSDLLLESPTFHLGGSGSTPFRSRLMFLSQYAAFHKRYQDGRKKEAAKILTGMLNSEIVPRWWWGVILLDAAGMCEDEELWFEEEDAYDLLRHVEEIYIRAEQGCGSDYLEALEKIMQASQKNHPASSAGKREATKDDQSPIKQLEVVRLSLARYLARSFTATGGL